MTGGDLVDKRDFMKHIHSNGILADDPRIKNIIQGFEDLDENHLTKQ